MTTKTLPDSTTAAYYYNGSGVTLVNSGIQGAPGESGINFGFVVAGNNDTLVNNGTVFGQRVGVYVTGSSDGVINAAGKNIIATLPDQAGVNFYNFSGTVTNYGTISGYAGAANGNGGNAVEMRHGGLVTNFGTLENGGALFRLAPGTLVNSGVVLGNAAYGGVYMEAGGTVTNLAGGLISSNGATESYEGAPPYGVFIVGGAATVTNAGTINGGSGNAVLLPTGFQNRVVVDPGAVFVGTVNGGTAVDATLELASGASQGTLSGIGTQFINFGTLAFDSSASWRVDATTSIASATLTGFGATDTIDLGGFVAVSDTFSANTLVLTNASNAHVTMHVQGTFTTANFTIANDGDGGTDIGFTTAASALVYGQTIDETGVVATSETVSAGMLTLFNGGGTAVGTIAVGTSLVSGDFTLRSDGSGGTDVIVDTIFGTYEAGVTLLTNPTTIASTASVNETNGSALSNPGGANWSITNYGAVNGDANANGVQLGNGGTLVAGSTITNEAGGTIRGRYGVILYNGTNDSIVNLAGGTIAATGTNADRAIDMEVDSGTVINAGLITSQTTGAFDVGVELDGGGSLTNTATGTISGGWGVLMAGPGTVTNAGTISGVYSNEFAVALNSGDRLIVDPGAVFDGAVNGGRIGGSSTLELASAASAGTLAATNFTNFSTIDFDAGAAWMLQGATTALSGAIVGFTIGDTIDLTGFVAVSQSFTSNALVLTDSSSAHETLNIQGAFTTSNFRIGSDGSGGTDITFQTPPTITAGGTVSFAGGGPAVVLDSTLSVADPNSETLVSGTVSIGAGFIPGDVLNFTDQNNITGNFDPSDGILTLSGTASVDDYQAALDSITYSFTPGSGDPTAGGADDSRTISWTVTDGVSSSDVATSTLDVTHNPPVIGGTVAGQATTDEAAIDPFSGVAITDPNIGQAETVTITLSNPANGTLSNLDGGTFNNGTYVVSGTTLAVTAAIDGLVFTPTAHQVAPGDAATTSFTITTTDSYGDSATDTTTTVIATAVNDAPVITQTTANLGVPNENASTLFAGLTVTDPDVGHIDTLTVTLSDPANGVLSDLSGGSYDAATGIYTVTGSALAVTAALQALVFTPAAPTSGYVAATTNFSVAVTGPGGTATNDAINATAVSQVFGLGSVPSGDDAISTSPDGSSFPAPVGGDNNEAVVTDPSSGSTYDVPSGYQAEFLGGTAGATLSDPSAGNALLIGNNGNDTLTAAAGNDTLAAGTGDNLLSVSGANDAIDAGSGLSTVDAGGSNDTVVAGSGMISVFATGSDANVLGNTGGLSVLDTGTNDTIGAFGASSAVVSLGASSGLAFGGSNAFTASVGGTSNTLAGGSGSTSATLSGSAGVVFGGSGSLSLYDNGLSDTIAAFGASSANVSLAGGDALLFGGSNSISVTASNSFQTIVGGSGAASISIANIGDPTNDEVLGGSGNLTVDDEGQGDTIASFAAAPANVTLGGQSAGDLLFGGVTSLNATVEGTNDTVAGGSGPSTIDANSGAVVFGGSGPLSFVGGVGTSTILGASDGSEMVTVGSGGVLFFAGADDNPTILGGSGITTVVGGAGSGVVFSSLSGGGGLDFLAATGNESLDAANSSTSNTFGFFDSTMSLGGGAHDTVTGWSTSDSLFLVGYESTAATTVDGGGNFTIDLTHGATITFTDASSSAFMGRMLFVPPVT